MANDFIIGIGALLASVFGWVFTKVYTRLSKCITREEANEMIENKLVILEQKQLDLKEDVKVIDKKLDHVINILLKKKR